MSEPLAIGVAVTRAGDGRVRALRADARRNHAHLLAAARDRFIAAGPGVPLEDVARAAGVGIATLYRRFPDRQALMRAVVLEALQQTRDVADTAVADIAHPLQALSTYMHGVLDLRTSALIPALLAELSEDDVERAQLSDAITASVEAILEAGQASGVLRQDIAFGDIGVLLVRLSRPLPGGLAPDVEAAYGHRHLDIVLAGLAATDDRPLAGPPLTRAELRIARRRSRPRG